MDELLAAHREHLLEIIKGLEKAGGLGVFQDKGNFHKLVSLGLLHFGLSQSELSRSLSVRPANVNQWLRKGMVPSYVSRQVVLAWVIDQLRLRAERLKGC